MPAAFEPQDTNILSSHQGYLKSNEDTNTKQKEQESQNKWENTLTKSWEPGSFIQQLFLACYHEPSRVLGLETNMVNKTTKNSVIRQLTF